MADEDETAPAATDSTEAVGTPEPPSAPATTSEDAPVAADAPTQELTAIIMPAEPAPEVVAETQAAEPAPEDVESAPEPEREAAEAAAGPEPEPEPAPGPAAEPEGEPSAEPEAEPSAEPEAEPELVPEPVADGAEEGPAHAKPRRSVWKTLLVAVVALIGLAAAAVAGVVYGRSTVEGPNIVITGQPVVEASAATDQLPVGTIGSAPRPVLFADGTRGPAPTAVLTSAAGLDDSPTAAPGYRLINSGISGAQVASVLGTAFGVTGAPVRDGEAWTVGTEGGSTLTVREDPLYSWSFEDPAALASPAVGKQLDPPDAIEIANGLLSGIGVDTSSLDWQVERFVDRTQVTAWQLIDDKRTQLGWQLDFDPQGAVLKAHGFSAGLEPIPDYQVVGAATAVKRSQTAPWWVLGPAQVTDPAIATVPTPSASPAATSAATGPPTFGPEPSASTATASPSPSPSVSTSPATASATATASAGEPAPPSLVTPVSEVTVTEAELGLAQYWQPDGSVLMLPSYLLTGQDGSRWSLIAIADQYVDFAPVPQPSAS